MRIGVADGAEAADTESGPAWDLSRGSPSQQGSRRSGFVSGQGSAHAGSRMRPARLYGSRSRRAHHASPGRRTPGFRIDVRIGVQGVVHLLVLELRRQGRPRSGGHRPIWLGTAFLRRLRPRTVRRRCGAAHPHVEAPQEWSGRHRPQRPFRFAGLLCRLEPLPGQRPAVHPVPAGQTVPGILQGGDAPDHPRSVPAGPLAGKRPRSAGGRDRSPRCGRPARRRAQAVMLEFPAHRVPVGVAVIQ